MSVIQKIRDKYARVAVIAIAVALIGFILTDYITGKSRTLFSGNNSSAVGRVDGKKIDLIDFNKKVAMEEENEKRQGYLQPGDEGRQRVIEQVWNQEVNKILISSEISRLGMQVEKRELNDILFGVNAPEDIKKAGTDPQTNQYNPSIAQQEVNRMKKKWTQEQRDQFNQYLADLEFQRMSEKYNSLMLNSANFPRWMIEKQNADNSLMAKISFVKESYASIPDTSIKITDEEIADYISKHKEDYKQEESRSIAYVKFSALPTAADTATIMNQVFALKPQFDTVHDVAGFLNSNISSMPLFEGYTGKSFMKMPFKDSIQQLSTNKVFGPYLDGGNFVMAKMLETKELPDSVKCRHILLGTTDRSGQPIMDDSVAHKLADSVALAIKNGANFDSLETKFSTDKAAHQQKGVMTFSSSDIQGEGFAKEFGQFILFDGKPGDKKVVKTSFGYHYIEILSFIKPETHYKIAYMARQIVASDQTDKNANNDATNFAANSQNEKQFDETFEKVWKPKGYNKGIATDIGPNAYDIPGIGPSRIFVKEIYDAKQGQVLLANGTIGTDYVVAMVTEINKEGTKTPAKARLSIEPILRNMKKGEMLAKKIGKITTLEAAAAALGGKPIEAADSLRMMYGSRTSTMGFEGKVNGAAFNPANKGKVVSEPLKGVNGVYVVRVDNVSATALSGASVADERRQRYEQAKQGAMYNPNITIDALRQAATITDRRSKQQL